MPNPVYFGFGRVHELQGKPVKFEEGTQTGMFLAYVGPRFNLLGDCQHDLTLRSGLHQANGLAKVAEQTCDRYSGIGRRQFEAEGRDALASQPLRRGRREDVRLCLRQKGKPPAVGVDQRCPGTRSKVRTRAALVEQLAGPERRAPKSAIDCRPVLRPQGYSGAAIGLSPHDSIE
jgi:hypothetical protein